ncbi:ABC transporter permease [Mycoplasmopsis adleri]|uniref:ABC transporter permease n=1 Tax=Mycoplasmopsis adleri TaxID=51362 RepID=UPI0038737D6E
MVIGLSILVFLTSAVFTLLSTLRTTIVSGFNNYKQVSKMQDIVVDLNLPTQGIAYNQGYFVNGQAIGKDGVKQYTPITYDIKNPSNEYKPEQTNALFLPKSEYLNINDFNYKDTNKPLYTTQAYIKKSAFETLYSIYLADVNNPNVQFDLTNPESAFIKFLHPVKFTLYNEHGKELTQKLTLPVNQELTFTPKANGQPYTIGDLMTLRYETIDNVKSIVAEQVAPLFINIKTKEITPEYSVGNRWLTDQISVRINANDWIKYFGFKPYNTTVNGRAEDSEYVFMANEDPIIDLSKFVEYNGPDPEKLTESLKLKSKWDLQSICDHELSIDSMIKIEIPANNAITLPKTYLGERKSSVKFERWNYFTTYVGDTTKQWSGAFATFMNELQISANDPKAKNHDEAKKLWKSLETFSYWRKIKETTITFYSNNESKTKRIVIPIVKDDLNVALYTNDPRTNRPNGTPYKIPDTSATGILNIDNYLNSAGLSLDSIIELLNDNDIRNQKYNLIKLQAYDVTKNTIINKVEELVGKDNIGLRKTLTVDAINDESGKQNVFHFINTGDEHNVVDGVKLNVGKLFNEEHSPSILNHYSNMTSDSIYKQKQLPSFVASMLIQSIGRNLYPNPKYIEPIYYFTPVIDVNPKTNEITKQSSKIVMLNKFLLKDDPNATETAINDEYKKLNLGITFRGNYYKLVTLVEDEGKLVWQTVYPEGVPFEGFDKGFLTQYLDKNQLTVATNFIKVDGDGWVRRDKQLSNIYYVPLEFLSPKAELINEILTHGKVDYLANSIEKYLLNFELVKDGFITSEQVFHLTSALKKVLNDNNFANVFSTSKLNKNILPKIAFDLLYELSHNESGDVLLAVFNNIFDKAKSIIQSQGNLSKQKIYLTSEVQNLYDIIKGMSNFDLGEYISASDLVNLSNDPAIFIDAVKTIFASINFYKFSELAREWYQNSANKTVLYQNEQYTNRLSTGLIIDWIFKSIDQRTLKNGLSEMIQNIDLHSFLDLDSSNSFLYKLLINKAPWLISSLKPILAKISPDGQYTNFKEGLISIIRNIDFNAISSYLDSHMTMKYFDYVKTVYDPETNRNKQIKDEKIALPIITPNDGMMSLIYGMFSNPGTNRAFKLNLIKMFNLSDKTTSQTINGVTINIPANDPDKLGLFDFLSIFTNGLEASSPKIFANYQMYEELTKAQLAVTNLEPNKKGTLDLFSLPLNIQAILQKYNLNTYNTKEELIGKINDLLFFVNQTKGGTNSLIGPANETATDYLATMYRYEDGNAVWQGLKAVLTSATPLNITNEYSLGAQSFSLYTPWIKLAQNPSFKDLKDSNAFLKKLLEFSINNEILRLTQALATDNNLPFSGTTDFGISNILLHPNTFNLFNLKNDKFEKPIVQNYFGQNATWKKIVLENKDLLLEQVGLIAASKKYSSDAKVAPNGIYWTTINKFVNGYLNTPSFWNVRHEAYKLALSLGIKFPIKLFGISPVIINPIMRAVFPQMLLIYVSSESTDPGTYKGNLANIVFNRTGNFEEILKNNGAEIAELFGSLWQNNDTSAIPLDISEEQTLVLDGAKIWTLFTNNKVNKKLFGIDLLGFINSAINSIVEPKEMKDIVFNNIQSYLAKVNYAYLAKNNKAIYNGPIPTNNVAMEQLINTLEDRYILDVNGIKFLIVGEDTTIDYIYPVIDENNLQVNTSNQALVYVNDSGFSRVVAAYQGNVVKKSLLVANGLKYSNKVLQQKIIEIVDRSISDSNKLQRVFAYNEVDPINPERALRITTIEGIIKAVSISTIILISIFIILVAVSIIFIIKRYITNKAKVLGILVAQGYRPIEIAFSLTVFAAVTSIIGGILGYSIGNRAQLYIQNIFSAYWTLPKAAIKFDFITMILTVFIPFISMSALIIIVALIELRRKPHDLITGAYNVPTGKLYNKVYKTKQKKNVKRKFAFALTYTGFGKLMSFGASVLLTSVATMFGVANIKVFSKTINETYANRNYKFKVDLESPTTEGGIYSTYTINNLQNIIYTPIGDLAEGNRETSDYFKPGNSSIINSKGLNGNPGPNAPHVLSQFSVNVAVDAGVAADPWLVAYNGMPDSQKVKIDRIRDQVGYELEWSQNLDDNGKLRKTGYLIKVDSNGLMSYENEKGEKASFFKYYKSPYDKQGSFKYAKWDATNGEYVMTTIKTGTDIRNQYREFVVNGYKKINAVVSAQDAALINKDNYVNPIENWVKNNKASTFWLSDTSDLSKPWVNDYFISFGGVLYNNKYDQEYTYLDVQNANDSMKIYGYEKPENINNAFIKLVDQNGNNLYNLLYGYEPKNDVYPLVINEVVRKKYNWNVGTRVSFEINNKVDRYVNKIKEKVYENDPAKLKELKEEIKKNKVAQFEIIGINPTYINKELITTKDAANTLIGFKSAEEFNGIITQKDSPAQVTDSTSLYSISGYWSGYDGFDLSTLDENTIKNMFDQIFDVHKGVLATQAHLSADVIAKFLDPKAASYSQELYNVARDAAKDHIEDFSRIYNNKLYIALGMSIDSKDIEVGFTEQIGSTIEQISIFVIVVCFAISLIILIIMATIMISENEKNIAIWSILGYTNKEKIQMFFGTFTPFLVGAILLSIPIVILMIYSFNIFLLMSSSIALSLTLKWWHILLTAGLMFLIFAITSVIVWDSINKMKPVDLLKGK